MSTEQTLMLVEDSEDDIFFMKRAMKSAGITNPLQVVEDGQSTIDYLSGTGQYANRDQFPLPSLILLDLKLPQKSGLEVLKWIREQRALETIIVIVMTSSKEDSDVETAYRLGANSYLVKPPTAEKLLELANALKLYWIKYNEYAPVQEK